MKRPTLPDGTPPADVARDLVSTAKALDDTIPAKRDDNLLIGTWNIRALSRYTDKWNSAEKDSPRRDWHALTCIAEILSRFDITAIQETRRNTQGLLALLARLGEPYEAILSDVTEGDAGNGERLVYVYDKRRVQANGLVGEVVLPPVDGKPVEQFARTPYAASFERAGVDLTLTTVHVIWGDRPSDRIGELQHFARWMRDWAKRTDDWNQNLLVLGDFNLDRLGDRLFEAFVETGLWPPTGLNAVPRTIFDHDGSGHFYDQIAWFNDVDRAGMPSLLDGLAPTGRCGSFDFLPHALPGLTKNQVSWRISDHYPLWVEFELAA